MTAAAPGRALMGAKQRKPSAPKVEGSDKLRAQLRARILPRGELIGGLYGVIDDPAYYVPVSVFRWVCEGFELRAAIRALSNLGALRRNYRGGFKHREALPDGRRARVYVLLPEPLGLPPFDPERCGVPKP